MATKRKSKLVSGKYERRIKNIGPATRSLMVKSKPIMIEGLQIGTKKELYDRTPLTVTWNMYKSIGAMYRGMTVYVGYNVGNPKETCDHALRRLKMKGISKKGGHKLNMNVEKYISRNAVRKINLLAKECQKKILYVGEG